ncbi:MAG: sugar phosphate nucleotidyltransferase [Candidatus Njordarchaeia archaeon]
MSLHSAIIMAAGKSSRFWPLNYKHKTLLRLMGKPLVQHLIEELIDIGFEEIVIVSSPKDESEFNEIREKNSCVDIKIAIQKEPRGGWDAVLTGVRAATGDYYVVFNAHQLGVQNHLKRLLKTVGKDPVLTLVETNKPEMYGVVKIRDNKVIDVVEKPRRKEAPSNLRIVGIYLFGKKFIDYLEEKSQELPKEEEYKLEKSLASYAREKGIDYIEIEEEPLSLRYPWDLFHYMKYLFSNKIKETKIGDAKISKWAAIEGPVIIEDGAKISRHTSVIGPTYIGKGAFVGDQSVVRNVDLEESSVIGAHFEAARSILQPNSSTHSGYLGDSIIGEDTKIGAGFISANRRFDRKVVKAVVKGKKIETEMKKLGVIIGRGTSIGIMVGTMPGILIGSDVVIGPGKIVYSNVKDGERLLD